MCWDQWDLVLDIELARVMDTGRGWDMALRGDLVWDLDVDRTGELGVR
jgi:hypothetical protein